MFDTGTNEWKTYPAWPPKQATARPYYLNGAGQLALAPTAAPADEYVSDPAHPVPYAPGILSSRSNEYMIADQRFAAERPDVLTFQTLPLPADLTVAGPLAVNLWVSTSGTDADLRSEAH